MSDFVWHIEWSVTTRVHEHMLLYDVDAPT